MQSQERGNEASHVRSAEAGSVDRTDEGRGAVRRFRSSINALLTPGRRGRLAVAAGMIFCLGLAAAAESTAASQPETRRIDTLAEQSAVARRAGGEAASRSTERGGTTPESTPAKAPQPKAPVPKPAPPKPVRPAPVAGLTQAQMDNANVIVQVGLRNKMPRKALVIAIATAMQESALYNLASGVLPESQRYPHQGVGWDHDSVGLFQQRTSSGWGAVRDLMRPEFAATQFYNALRQVSGWQWMPVTVAAQSVQRSAFPYAYAKHEWLATTVVNAIVR